MTEPTTTIPETFDLLDYITSGTIARREVVIYADEQAGRELLETIAKLRQLGWSDEEKVDSDHPKDGPLDEPDVAAEIEPLLDQARAAQERLDASRSVWTVQALSKETADRILDEHPLPKPPLPPKETASDRERERWQARYDTYRDQADKVQREQRYALLAVAITAVESPGGAVDGVTLDQIHAIDSRPGGQKWIDRLWAALDEAQSSDPDVPRPTWLGRSTTSLA